MCKGCKKDWDTQFIVDGLCEECRENEPQEKSAWRNKVNQVILSLCADAYKKANILPNGQKRKRHVPYSVPELAQELVKALGEDNEEKCKSLMMWEYDSPTNKKIETYLTIRKMENPTDEEFARMERLGKVIPPIIGW